MMSQFHKKASVVIIGQGGIVGASVAHHLIERGWDNIIGIDKSGIPTDIGSTGHASDFCFNTMHDQMTIFTTKYSIDFLKSWDGIPGSAGSRSPVRMTTRGCASLNAGSVPVAPSAAVSS
ncbi:MAG: FAD-dependent oxidoreductase [Rhodospirillales bacterium]